MKPPIILIGILLKVAAQVTVPITGQCQAVCLKEFATRREFITLAGTTFIEFDVVNNTEFSLCKLGCNTPDFNGLQLPAFLRGQLTYRHIIENNSIAPLTVSPIEKVVILCSDSFPNSTIFGRLFLTVRNATANDAIVHHVEGVKKSLANEEESIFFSSWSYTPLVEFALGLPPSGHVVQFRVTSFGIDGLMGEAARTEWIHSEAIANSALTPLIVKTNKVFWREESAANQLLISSNQIPACSLSLTFSVADTSAQHIEFIMDRSSGFLLERLKFENSYEVRIEPSFVATNSAQITITVPSCLEIVDNPAMCAPLPVTDFEWKWNSSKIDGHSVLLSWVYDEADREMPSSKREASHSRLVHFDVTMRPTGTEPFCKQMEPQQRVVTWTHRSVSLYVPDERCQYEAEVVVVDWKNRRSRPTRAIVEHIRETKSVLALTSEWNAEMFILVGFLVALILTAGGMAVCRFRDRSDFNTLKKEHRQLTKSIIVAQCTSTLPRSQCLTIVDGRGRPISSDESELSANSQSRSPGILQHKFFCDEGVYDSLDTPSRSEGYFERSSAMSFHRANPIYAGINVHGLMTVPIDRLNVTMYTKNSAKPWVSANVVDNDGAAYSMKYSAEDSSALRLELGIVSRISTDHPFLIYFHGLAVRESQVLALLFEPARGGTLATFLADARDSLSRDVASRSSSGYDGSEHGQDSLDRFQRQIDRVTAHLYAFARQISGGLSFLHAQQCSHGALTSEAIHLLKSYKDPLRLPCDQVVKIGDYEYSRMDGSVDTIHQMPSHSTPPEVLSGKQHTTAGDLWQMGLLICEMVSLGSVLSLYESCAGNICDKTVKNYYSRLSTGHDLSNRIDPGLVLLKQLAPKCLLIDPKKRILAREFEREVTNIQPPAYSYREHSESVEV